MLLRDFHRFDYRMSITVSLLSSVSGDDVSSDGDIVYVTSPRCHTRFAITCPPAMVTFDGYAAIELSFTPDASSSLPFRAAGLHQRFGCSHLVGRVP